MKNLIPNLSKESFNGQAVVRWITVNRKEEQNGCN